MPEKPGAREAGEDFEGRGSRGTGTLPPRDQAGSTQADAKESNPAKRFAEPGRTAGVAGVSRVPLMKLAER
ncbi:MAG: hypothetical protein ACOYM2_21360 [Rectinemataceae bacterium]